MKSRRGRRHPAQVFRKRDVESLMQRQSGWAETSLRATMANYLEALAVMQRAESTRLNMARRLLAFARWAEDRGIAGPLQVTSHIVDSYQRHLFHARRANGVPLTPETQHHCLTTLRNYFRWCTRQRLIPLNPAADIDLPKRGHRLPRYCLSLDEVAAVLALPRLDTLSGLRDRAILEVMWAAALRRSEVVNLKLHDVRFDEGTVFVHQGKGRRDRVVPLSAVALSWVRRYLDEVRPRLWMPPENEALFLLNTGFPLTRDTLGTRVREYLDKAGIDAVGCCHLFRHASATALLEGGADVRYVQEFLGHVNLETTQVYTHVTLAKLKAVYGACHPSARPKSATPPTVSAVAAQAVLQALENEGDD